MNFVTIALVAVVLYLLFKDRFKKHPWERDFGKWASKNKLTHNKTDSTPISPEVLRQHFLTDHEQYRDLLSDEVFKEYGKLFFMNMQASTHGELMFWVNKKSPIFTPPTPPTENPGLPEGFTEL